MGRAEQDGVTADADSRGDGALDEVVRLERLLLDPAVRLPGPTGA